MSLVGHTQPPSHPMKRFKRLTIAQLVAYAKAHPATSDYAFGERSGKYTITPPTPTPPAIPNHKTKSSHE